MSFWSRQSPHGCSSPCWVKTSDQLHSAWPIWTYSQCYCCLIWHFYEAFIRHILLCFTLCEHLIVWCSNQCRHPSLYRTGPTLDRPTRPHTPPLRQPFCRCDLHIPQLVGINFNMFNLMVAIDARGRGGWSACVSTYWLPCSHVLVTGGLIGSRLVIFHSNRKQMKCLCYMQCCWLVTIREELWPFPLFLLYISVISYISFCPSSSP